MEENQNLDGLSQVSEGVHSDMQRPKLKKIKRPKIRPISDVPPAPEKKIIEESAVSSDEAQNNEPEVSAPAEDVRTSSQNSLVTSKDAQNLLNSNEVNNSYVLDGLPPELEYDTEDGGNFDYPESNESSMFKSLLIGGLCLAIGLGLGYVFFSSKKVEQHGLEGVVLNPDVPQGRVRCGLTDQSQACVFYVMNWYKQELNGRSFYKLAAQLTGREEHMIETENIRYSLVKIAPGHFAQLNIPALK